MVNKWTCEEVEVEIGTRLFTIAGSIEAETSPDGENEERTVSVTEVREFVAGDEGTLLDIATLAPDLLAALKEAVEDQAQADDEHAREERENR